MNFGFTTNNEELVTHLVDSQLLKTRSIIDAMKKIPRGEFVPAGYAEECYIDQPMRLLEMGFNVSAPHMYAICLEQLQIENGMSLLDIGSGCGLLTAMGAFLVGKEGQSFGVDIRDEIVAFSKSNVEKYNASYNSTIHCTFEKINCFFLESSEKQFDRIHCGASCPGDKLHLLERLLKPKGILVTPSGSSLLKIIKKEDGKIETKEITGVRYGELAIPSEAEMREYRFSKERKKYLTIRVPNSNLVEELHKSQLQEEMVTELSQMEFREKKDGYICFLVGPARFYASKAFLSNRLIYFRSLFSSGMRDANSEVISVVCTQDPTIFLEFLRFCHTDTCNLNHENAFDLLELASFYQFEKMICHCELFIKESVDVENVCEIIQDADRFSANQLKSYCSMFIIEHYDQICETEAHSSLPRHLLDYILKLSSSLLAVYKNQ